MPISAGSSTTSSPIQTISRWKRCAGRLDDPDNDTQTYELEGGEPILFWRRDGRIHGNTLGHDERDILESSIANGIHPAGGEPDDPPPF